MAAQLIVHPLAAPLRGSVPVPGDQEIALARMALAVTNRGRTSIALKGEQSSVARFASLIELLGATVQRPKDVIHIQGLGLTGGSALQAAVDLRGDAHVAALALGLLVSRPWPSEIHIDEVVVQLLVPALQQAHELDVEPIDGSGNGASGYRVAIAARPGESRCEGLSVSTHGVYSWVKQALLLAGLRAKSPSYVEERLASADHLERAMTRARMPLDVQGTSAVLHPPRDDDAVAPQVYDEIGSHDLAWPLAVAGLMHKDSEVSLREVGTNPTRADFLQLLKLLGAPVGITPRGDRQGEPFGDVSVRSARLTSVQLGGESVIRLGDGAVVLLAACARAEGESHLTDLVARARGADPKIWGRALGILRNAGVEAETTNSGLRVVGRGGDAFEPLTITTGGDSRLALLATVLALGAKGPSVIDDVECLAGDFPRWAGTLRALGAQVEVKPA